MLSPDKPKSAQRSLLSPPQHCPSVQADMLSPGRHRPAQRSLLSPDQHRQGKDDSPSPGRHTPVQRSLLSPARKRVVRNLRSPRHANTRADQACVAEPSLAVNGVLQHGNALSDRLRVGHQKQPAAAPWGPRPGSATLSSTLPVKPATATQQQAPSQPMQAPARSPFASVAQQPHNSHMALDEEQSGSRAAGLGTRPQSASFSNEMLHQVARDKPVSELLLEQHSMPAQTFPAAAASSEAAMAEAELGTPPSAAQPASLTDPRPAAEAVSTAGAAEAAVEVAAVAQDDAFSVEAAEGRPSSAFAHVAELDPPGDWQAGRQAEMPRAEQPSCADLNGVDQQVRLLCRLARMAPI